MVELCATGSSKLLVYVDTHELVSERDFPKNDWSTNNREPRYSTILNIKTEDMNPNISQYINSM